MLNEGQIAKLWEKQIAAEVRSLYFADLTNHNTRIKKVFTAITLFASTSAAATLVARTPYWVPTALSTFIALITSYSIAIGLDSKIQIMAKLHYSWSALTDDYENLWSHTYAEDAERTYNGLLERDRELSLLASTDAENDKKRMSRWQDEVLKLHNLVVEAQS